jgi:hypothetical protein
MVVFNVCSPHSYVQFSGVLTELKSQVDWNGEPVSTLLSPRSIFVKVRIPDSGEGIPSENICKALHSDPRLKKLEEK